MGEKGRRAKRHRRADSGEKQKCLQRLTILAPKGIRESRASLKNCFPKGIPTMVRHQSAPKARWPRAMGRPNRMKPDDVGQCGRCSASENYFLFERRKRQACKFETLPAIRDANDADTPDKPGKPPGKAAQKAAKHKPENIADCFHCLFSSTYDSLPVR